MYYEAPQYHTTKNGKVIFLRDLELSHLKRIIRIVEHNLDAFRGDPEDPDNNYYNDYAGELDRRVELDKE